MANIELVIKIPEEVYKSIIMTERDQFMPETTTYQAFDESIKIINKYKEESEG